MNKIRKNNQKFGYHHPILKSFSSIAQQTHPVSPYAYQSVHTIDSKTIPHKMLRSSHIKPLLGSGFSLLLQPFHPQVQVNKYDPCQVLVCEKCKSVINSSCMIKLSLSQHRCRFCNFVEDTQYSSGRYLDSSLFESQILEQSQTPSLDSKILFLIEANQLLSNKEVNLSIFQCLKALAPNMADNYQLNKSMSVDTERTQEQYLEKIQTQKDIQQKYQKIQVGFVLFDSEKNYIINMSTGQLVLIKPENFTFEDFPLTESQMFQPISEINLDDIELIVQEIMENKKQIKSTCLAETLKLYGKLAQLWQLQVKVFACSHDNQAKLASNKKKGEITKKLVLQIDPRVQILVVDGCIYGYLKSVGLQKNILRSYTYRTLNPSDIYYDLYHNLTQQVYYNVQISVSTSELVSTNKQHFKVPILTSNTPLILDFFITGNLKNFKLKEGESADKILTNQVIQIQMEYKNIIRVITYQVPQIQTNNSIEPFILNDEAFFYIMLCKLLDDKNSSASMKKLITTKCGQIMNKVMYVDDLSVPANLTNFFMYSFMVSDYGMCEKKNTTFLLEKAFIFNEGLETVTKWIYPKTYEFYPQIKALKFRPKSFLHDSVRVVDNGKFIGIVVGDQVEGSTLLKLFDTQKIQKTVDWRDIPMLQNKMNEDLHKIINFLRERNELYFLPIRIIPFDSHEFGELYGNYLYIENEHRDFFKRCIDIK